MPIFCCKNVTRGHIRIQTNSNRITADLEEMMTDMKANQIHQDERIMYASADDPHNPITRFP